MLSIRFKSVIMFQMSECMWIKWTQRQWWLSVETIEDVAQSDTASSTSGYWRFYHISLFTLTQVEKWTGPFATSRCFYGLPSFWREESEVRVFDSLSVTKLVIVKTAKCTMNRVQLCMQNIIRRYDKKELFGGPSRYYLKCCVLVGLPYLTQWPTYRLYHCTQRRQSGQTSKLNLSGAERSFRRLKVGRKTLLLQDSFIAKPLQASYWPFLFVRP